MRRIVDVDGKLGTDGAASRAVLKSLRTRSLRRRRQEDALTRVWRVLISFKEKKMAELEAELGQKRVIAGS